MSRQAARRVRVAASAAALLACIGSAFAQDALWKCGGLYTDQPRLATGPSCAPATVASFSAGAPQKASTRVAPALQKARDEDARAILQGEIAQTLARRATLVAAEARTPPASYAIEMRRLEADLESLHREIARLPREKP